MKTCFFNMIIISFILISCSRSELKGKWIGTYKDYSYELNIDGSLNYILIKEEKQSIKESGTLKKENGDFVSQRNGIEYIFKSNGYNKLKIIPRKTQKDLEVLSLVEFKKVD